ncbi:MAG: polysaccharide deacetylase family protein [Candidatus Coatesbacteria bacterium]
MKIVCAVAPLAVLIGLAGPAGAAPASKRDCQVVMDTYVQEFTIGFASEEAAGKALVEMTPLYEGREWAISSRWDDNRWSDLEMKRVLEKYGYKATWYLNETTMNYFGSDYGLLERGNGGARLAMRLGANGFSIGGHTLSHSWMEALNRNRAWWEMMGVRIDRESETDRPVISYGTPFGFTRDITAGRDLFDDLDDLVVRAGYYHGDGPDCFIGINYLPGDGANIDRALATTLADPKTMAANPSMCLGYHVEFGTPDAWRLFEAQLKKYAHNPKWWYCNWNEYAAYRWQVLHTQVRTARLGNGKLGVTLVRPELVELNDAVPLTFVIRGVRPRSVKAIESRGAVGKLTTIGGAYAFNLGHDAPRALPARIDQLATGRGTPGKFPFLSASLTRKGTELELEIGNSGDQPLRDVRLVYRLPLAWKNGLVKRKPGDIPAKGSAKDTLALASGRTDWPYRAGASQCVAQLDFTRGGEPGRLYVVLTEPEAGADASYPRSGFLTLGPLSAKLSDVRAIAAAVSTSQGRTERILLDGGRSVAWTRVAGPRAERVGAEIVCTVGDSKSPDDKPYHYLLLTSVTSDRRRRARIVGQSNAFPAVYLDGKEVSGDGLELRKGPNDLLLVYASGGDNYSPRHFGPFLRIVDAKTGARLTGIEYRPEQVVLDAGKTTSLAGAPAAGKARRVVFDDFEDGDMTNLAGSNGITDSNGTWVASADGFSGSKVQVEVAAASGNPSKAAMHVTGFRGRNDPAASKYSWVTVAGATSARSGTGMGSNLAGTTGISFRARSAKPAKAEWHAQEIFNGRDLSRNGSSHRAGFDTGPEWRDYAISWDDFTQPDWLCPGESCAGAVVVSNILSLTLNFPVDGADVDLWLDDVALVYK